MFFLLIWALLTVTYNTITRYILVYIKNLATGKAALNINKMSTMLEVWLCGVNNVYILQRVLNEPAHEILGLITQVTNIGSD